MSPAPDPLKRHARQHTAHAALIGEILSLLASTKAAPPPAGPRPLYDPDSELPGAAVPADQLYLSVNTVKTHTRNRYGKLGVHRRHEAVEHARVLGLLAPSPHRGQAVRAG